MEKLFNGLQKYATGKLVSVLFVLTQIVYLSMIAYSIPAVTAFAPELPLFDMSPTGYTFAYANELLSTLGAEGRHLYLTTQLPLDCIYPGLFSLSYSLLLIWLFRKTFKADSKVYYVAVVPFLGGIFDYIENLFIIKMINSFPNLQAETVEMANAFTILKSSFVTIFFVLLLVGFALLLKQKLSARTQS
ncbi:MAG: hypothetical protein V7765_12195 [Oleispira sp.]